MTTQFYIIDYDRWNMPASHRQNPRTTVLILLTLLGVAILAWWTLQWVMRGPLAGDVHHDFGEVAMPERGPAILNYTFELTNRTNRPLTIQTARPDCGCLTINAAFPLTVAPREDVDLPITMRYAGSDERGKTVHIRLVFADGERGQSLWVKAKPRPRTP